MCGIAGFYHPQNIFQGNEKYYHKILQQMMNSLYHRGPDQQETALFDNCGMAHTRLSIVDLENGRQPMSRSIEGHRFHIVYNGEIYNLPYLRKNLQKKNLTPDTSSDTETLLLSFLAFGHSFIKEVDGIFSFAVYDEFHNTLSLFRDPFGVKPLFYGEKDGTVIFSSEPKACFCYPGLDPELDLSGLNEIFSLGPAHTPDSGVFRGLHQVPPGCYVVFSPMGSRIHPYFSLESHPHTDSYEETIEKTSFLLQSAVQRQMISDVPICTFLSGGIDSSVVSSICSAVLRQKGERLCTYSFDFTGNDKYFQANSFQPSQDRPYVEKMVKYLQSDHQYLQCSCEDQADLLEDSVKAHDLPAMADVDSSMLYFCRIVSKQHKVVLTGECADEVFGGYPWFHREEFLKGGTFPWTPTLDPRKNLLSKELRELLRMEEYVQDTYNRALMDITPLPEENETETNRRQIGYLNIRFFMQTLLTRMDRTSMYSGLEARVPFADPKLVSYVYNIPWNMKAKDGLVKNILRQAAKGLLPDEILFRRKSPYPKSYNPQYEKLLTQRLLAALKEPDCKLKALLDLPSLQKFLQSPKDYGAPWYGQLMAGPQMIAYLLQIHYFFQEYKVNLIL